MGEAVRTKAGDEPGEASTPPDSPPFCSAHVAPRYRVSAIPQYGHLAGKDATTLG
jgi:hypothetical protein